MSFDAAKLQEDLARIGEEEWQAHFNKGVYDGDWSGVALRTTPGALVPLYPDPTKNEFADTELMEWCPYFREVLAALGCTVQFARLLKLAAGANIRAHRDYTLGLDYGTARLHVLQQR